MRHVRSATFLLSAAILAAAPPAGAEQKKREKSYAESMKDYKAAEPFDGVGRAAAREGPAVARERAVEAALADALRKAVRKATGSKFPESAYARADAEIAKSATRFIRGYKIASETPTSGSYLVALTARVDMPGLGKFLDEGGFFASAEPEEAPAAPEPEGAPVTIVVEGVRDYGRLGALRALLGGEVQGLSSGRLHSVRGTVARFRAAYAGDAQALAAELNKRPIRDAALQVRSAEPGRVVLVLVP